MRAGVRAGRFGLLLALLLVLLGVSAPVALSVGDGYRAPGIESVSSAPTVHDGLRDRVRVSVVARYAQATSSPDTSWATCPRAIGGSAPNGRSSIGETGRTGMPTAMSTPQSGRAPPLSCSA